MIIFTDFSYQGLDRTRIGYALARIGVENGAARIFGLNVILAIERLENIISEIDGELRGIRIERFGRPLPDIVLIGTDDLRVFSLVSPCQAVGGPLCRRRFEIVVVTRFLLELDQSVAHKVQDLSSKFLPFR